MWIPKIIGDRKRLDQNVDEVFLPKLMDIVSRCNEVPSYKIQVSRKFGSVSRLFRNRRINAGHQNP